jgi:hypothetical protein
MPLACNTWEMLTEHDLCRTPQEERHAKFRGLPAISVSELSNFGKTLLKLLRACLLADEHTADKHITIVDGGHLDVRTFYGSLSNTWKLEKKLFDFNIAHEGVFFCEAMSGHGTGEDNDVFCCTHAAVDLFSNMLGDLKPNDLGVDTHSASAAEVKRLVSMARTRTSRVPQNVLVAPTIRGGEVHVTWESFETQYARKHSSFNYAVTLHNAETCKDKSQYVLHKPGMSYPILDIGSLLTVTGQRHLCDCQPVYVGLAEDQHTFTGVDAGTGYFVTIRHDADVAIYATSINKCEVEAYREPSIEVGPILENTIEEDERRSESRYGDPAYELYNSSDEDEHSHHPRTDFDEVRSSTRRQLPDVALRHERRSPFTAPGELAGASRSPTMGPVDHHSPLQQQNCFSKHSNLQYALGRA